MKVLKFIGIGVLSLIVLLFVAAIFVSKEIKYSKSIVVNANAEKVWQHCGSLKAMDAWSPWSKKDPEMVTAWEGTPGQVGEKNSWNSASDKVGVGSQEITAIVPMQRLETALVFESPREDHAMAYVELKPADQGTEVTWGFESKAPVPFNVIMAIIGMEKMIGADYQQGLDNLKVLAESGN